MRAQRRHLALVAVLAAVAVAAPNAAAQGTGASGATTSSGASGASGSSGQPQRPTRIEQLPGSALATGVGDLTVRLNGPADSSAPAPTIQPYVAGQWSFWGDNETFTPAASFAPCGSYTLTIPAGTTATGYAPLGALQQLSVTIACPGVKALQEALARLNYLPYKLESFSGVGLNVPLTTGLAAERSYVLPHGWLKPAYRDAPTLEVGTIDPTTTGALEVWEQDHDIPVGTAPDAQIWQMLVREEALNHRNPRPYTWVTVTENTTPELLKVHENNHVAITSLANTGVPGAATQTGEFPIYVRYVSTTMIGTNVNGTHYDDPGIPWVNYFNGGDAVHGYPRASYGFPQSNGCVELPIPEAAKVYPLLMVGDMVDVSD